MDVELSWTEIRLGGLTGVDRRVRAIGLDRRRRFAQPVNWNDDIVGALAEIAVAKALDRYPSRGCQPDWAGDIGDYQVRATELPNGCLIVHEDDRDTACFILVVGTPPVLTIPGWILGADAKRPEWWRTDVRCPAFFVPQHALHPITELP
jgi:hypothetical protein